MSKKTTSSKVVGSYYDEDEYDFSSSNNISSFWPSTVTSLDDTDIFDNDNDPLHVPSSSLLSYKTTNGQRYDTKIQSSRNAIQDDDCVIADNTEVITINSDDDDCSQKSLTEINKNKSLKRKTTEKPIAKIRLANGGRDQVLLTPNGKKICGIDGCYNVESEKGEDSLTTLFKYPKHNQKLYAKWIEFTKAKLIDKTTPISKACTLICSDHFDEKDLERDGKLLIVEGVKRYKLKKGAIPVLTKNSKAAAATTTTTTTNPPLDTETKECVSPKRRRMNAEETKEAKKNCISTPSTIPPYDFQKEFIDKIVNGGLRVNEDATQLEGEQDQEQQQNSTEPLLPVNNLPTVNNVDRSKMTSTANKTPSVTASQSPAPSEMNDSLSTVPSTDQKSSEQEQEIIENSDSPLPINSTITRSKTAVTKLAKTSGKNETKSNAIVKSRSSISKKIEIQTKTKSTQTNLKSEEITDMSNLIDEYWEEIQKHKNIIVEKDKAIIKLTKKEATLTNKLTIIEEQKVNILQDKISALTIKLNKLTEEKRLLNEKIHSDFVKTLQNTFTENQVNMLLGSTEKCNWKMKEIFNALKIKHMSSSPSSSDDFYSYLTNDMKYPLPPLTTLKLFLSTLRIDFIHNSFGICPKNFEFLEMYAQQKSDCDRVTILSLNEFNLDGLYGYDEQVDEVTPPQKCVQVLMAYGLFSNWAQPIFMSYNDKIDKRTLLNIITQLNKLTYNVVGLVTDCKRRKLWKELQITIKKSYFEIYLNSVIKKIYVFFNPADILRIMRYWYIESGFILKDRTAITKELFSELIEQNPVETEIIYGFSLSHLDNKKRLNRRREIKLAEDLLSEYGGGILKELSICEPEVYEFFECLDKWYKLMYSDNDDKIVSYTGDLEQNLILDRCYETIKKMRHATRPKPLNYQKAVLISIESLKGLLNHISNYSSSVPVNKLNLNCARKFFKDLRKHGNGLRPTAVDIPNLLQKLLLAPLNNKITYDFIDLNNAFLNKGNQSSQEYVSVTMLNHHNISWQTHIDLISNTDDKDADSIKKEYTSEDESFKYIVYWIVKRFKSIEPKLAATDTEILHIPSEVIDGELVQPSKWWIENAKILENEFILYHKVGLRRKCVMKSLIIILINKYKTIPKEVIESFIKHRTFVRLTCLNTNTNLEVLTRRKKYLEKLKTRMINNQPKIIINDQVLLPPLGTLDATAMENLIPSEIIPNELIQLEQIQLDQDGFITDGNKLFNIIVSLKDGSIQKTNSIINYNTIDDDNNVI